MHTRSNSKRVRWLWRVFFGGTSTAGTRNLGLDLEPFDQRRVCLREGLLDETGHDDIAAHVNILAQVESYRRGVET